VTDTTLPDSIANKLRATVRDELQRRTVDQCVTRGFATEDQIRRAQEEQAKLAAGGENVSLLQVMLRMRFLTTQQYLGLADGMTDSPSSRQRLGRYELLREVGKGGIGTVYKAQDTQLRRIVALKTLRTDIAPVGVVAARLVREAQATAKLKHPGIVTVHDAGEIDGVPFIAMEFVEGRHLGEVLKEGKAKRDALVRILHKAARAIAHAHEQGVVHRDLKPGNILVRADGEPVIIDFGLARSLDPQEAKALTQSAIGTPFYMSPEQVRDSKSAGPATDVYALGVTLYESLTGRVPFDAATHFELFQRILAEDPRRPREIDPSIPPELETIALVAMAKEPRFRYGSARALADDLDRWLRGEPILARPPSLTQRAVRTLTRQGPRIAGAAAAVVLVVAGLFWLRADQQHRAFRQAKGEAERAFQAGDWAKALFEAERALAIDADDGVAKLAVDCRARMASKSADVERRERYQALQERLKPIDAAIRETRSFFYFRDVDIRAKLKSLEASLAELESLALAYAEFPDAWAALGTGWYLAGDLGRAERALAKAERVAPADAVVNFTLGRICLDRAMAELFVDESGSSEQRKARSQGLIDRARTYFAVKTEGWGGAREVDRRLAEVAVAVAHERWVDVANLCDEGIRAFAGELGSEEFWYLKSWTTTGTARLRCFEKALERRPHYAWAYLVRGNAKREAWDIDGAIADYTKGLESNQRIPYLYNNRGVARWLKGQIDAAIADYGEAIRLDPSYPTAYSNRAMAHAMKGAYDEGLADCDRAIELHARSAGAYVNRGIIRYAKGDAEGAIADYTKGLEFNPKSVAIFVNRAAARVYRGDVEGALKDFDAAMEADPSAGSPYAARGSLRIERGDLDAAEEDFEEAIRREPGNGEAYIGRARLRRGRGDLRGSMEDLDLAVRLNASNADALAERGLTLAELKRSDEAMDSWNRALAINPRHAFSYFCRATEHVVLGDNRRAMEDFNAALTWNRKYLPALVSRGILKEDTDMDGAMEDYNAALAINPKSSDALFNRGMAYSALGRLKEARSDLEESLRWAPQQWRNGPLAEQTLREVRKRLGE
jgi:tetratricopeptide (TPR) repeat protein/tRNA A-37 threonylcarbamoyl transferase component Bud32